MLGRLILTLTILTMGVSMLLARPFDGVDASSKAALGAAISNVFHYPVGPRDPDSVTEAIDGDGWYNAQDFGEFNPDEGGLHPAEDWNDERGGSSDPRSG